jgi:hypothetical protein
MIRRPTSPKIIIIHRRQIVMHERVRMDHLNRSRETVRDLRIDAQCGSYREQKARTDSFPRPEKTIEGRLPKVGRDIL